MRKRKECKRHATKSSQMAPLKRTTKESWKLAKKWRSKRQKAVSISMPTHSRQ
jgi:hypothetical protein